MSCQTIFHPTHVISHSSAPISIQGCQYHSVPISFSQQGGFLASEMFAMSHWTLWNLLSSYSYQQLLLCSHSICGCQYHSAPLNEGFIVISYITTHFFILLWYCRILVVICKISMTSSTNTNTRNLMKAVLPQLASHQHLGHEIPSVVNNHAITFRDCSWWI